MWENKKNHLDGNGGRETTENSTQADIKYRT